MIAYIKWEIIELSFGKVLILTASWLGYELGITDLTYSKISTLESIELFVYHHKTENSEWLYAFMENSEKQVFEEIIKISGIWPKAALQILSLWVENLAIAIKNTDNKTIETIKWIGKKMAEKIILELKDKDFINSSFSQNTNYKKQINLEKGKYDSVISTLSSMWYRKEDIIKVLDELPEEKIEVWEILTYVIKEL